MVQFYSIDSDDEETNQQHADHPDGMAVAVDRDHHSTGIRMTLKYHQHSMDNPVGSNLKTLSMIGWE